MTSNTKIDSRLTRLKDWLAETLGSGEPTVEPASADASFRRYFRVYHGGASYIAMDAPPEREDCRPFITVGRRMRQYGLNAPGIHAQDLSLGFLLLDDLGSTQYLTSLTSSNADSLYADALDALLQMQTRVPCSDLPPYDHAGLRREMDLFVEWFVQRHLQIEPDKWGRAVIDKTFAMLIESALEQPRVFVHRDYHSRNLMLCEPNPGILDFQDAVQGPVTYDLVSLLRDCYVAWPDADVRRRLRGHRRRLAEAGVVRADEALFERWFDWMGMQRHLKAIGIFARLNHRDGKAGYLAAIPRTFNYIMEACTRYTELHPFRDLMLRLNIRERLGP